MAGRTPHDAAAIYLATLQRALSCITNAVLLRQGAYFPGRTHFAALSGSPVRLAGDVPLALSAALNYRIVQDSPRNLWNVSVSGYRYAVEEPEGREIVAYHWHPSPANSAPFPHMHLGPGAAVGFERLRQAHLATGLVSVEDIVHAAITELGVRPRRSDWLRVLAETRVASA